MVSPRTRSSGAGRSKARYVIGEITRQDNRTLYLPYFDEGTSRHDSFIDSLIRRLPQSGVTRGKLRDLISQVGKGKYRLFYNAIVLEEGTTGGRKLF